jgi:hypothetical protein
MGIFQPLVESGGEGGQFTLNFCKCTRNFGLERFQFGIGGINVRIHSLDVL